MFTFWGLITAGTLIGGGPFVAGLWLRERLRSRSRNRQGTCASCGTAWSSARSADPYLIHGRLVCEDCAARARGRMPWHFATLGAAAAVATAFSIAAAGTTMLVLLPVAATAVMTLAAVQLMKAANRTAQRRIASRRFPDIEAVTFGSNTAYCPELRGPLR